MNKTEKPNTIPCFKLILSVFGLILCFSNSKAAGYDYTPTIVQISKSGQPDSVGFNIVEQLNALFYRKIRDETINLWDSPAKKIKIGKNALKQIEDQNHIKFIENDEIFVYEIWKLYRKQFEFQIAGFSFFRRMEDGKKLNLGYIDAAEVKLVLSALPIPTNANGQANLSYWSALMSKKYNFTLVKFGNKDLISNPGLSLKIQHNAFGRKKIVSNAYKIEDVKEVEYVILPEIDNASNNYRLIWAISNYFRNNRYQYFKLSNNQNVTQLDSSTIINVTRIEVVDYWRKSKDGNLTYQPISIRIFINEVPLKTLDIEEIEAFKLLVQFKPIDEFIREKDYKFTLKRINNQAIYAYKSDSFIKALNSGDWNRITYIAEN